jgi:hypothetical protein
MILSRLLSDLDLQVINYFLKQFKLVGSMFYLSTWEGAIIYISTIAFVISSAITNDNNKIISNKTKRNRL